MQSAMLLNSDKNQNNKALLLTNDVQSICQPYLKKIGINGFSYSRVFSDGSRSELWNNAEALHHTFLSKKYIVDTYTPDYYRSDERYVLLANKIENSADEIKKKYEKQLLDQKNLFNHDNCFMIVNKEDNVCEYFIFYTPTEFKSAINFYINNLSELENFSKHFKEQSKKLIQLVDQEKIVKPWRNVTKDIQFKSIALKFENEQGKPNAKLTKREIQVAHHIIEGKTAKESAFLLNISMRTVESYIENIKNKLVCNRKGDLIVKLIKSELFSADNIA